MNVVFVAGATGAVGQKLIERLLSESDETTIHLLSRRATRWQSYPQIIEHILPLDALHKLKVNHPVDAVFCCLGTTIKQAGSREAFQAVDYQAVVDLACWAKQHHTPQFHVVSSIGVKPKSRGFYLGTKYRMEQALTAVSFDSLYIYRPSMLLAQRDHFRFGESVGAWLMRLLKWLPSSNQWQPIHVEKVAGAMVNQSKHPETGAHIIDSAQIQRLS